MKEERKLIECRCENPECGKTFYVPAWLFHSGQQVRFCSSTCRSAHPGKLPKYIFTAGMDDLIRRVYQQYVGMSRRPVARALAEKLGLPRWRVSRRALELGCSIPRKKEPIWTEPELSILERFSHRHPSYIQKILKRNGFNRTEVGIVLKRKRMRLIANREGMSACQAAEFFGVDVNWVTRQIAEGGLKAERRETMRTEKQGGDIYYIREKHIRKFIIDNPELIDIRKIEKFYFIELLANGGVQ